jgi:chromosome segregation ATPase
LTIAENALSAVQVFDETPAQRLAREKAEAAHSTIETCVQTARSYENNAATLSMHADNAVYDAADASSRATNFKDLTVEFIGRVQDRISDIAAEELKECQIRAEEEQGNVEQTYEEIHQHKETIDEAVSEIGKFTKTIQDAKTAVTAAFEGAEEADLTTLDALLEVLHGFSTTATESMESA